MAHVLEHDVTTLRAEIARLKKLAQTEGQVYRASVEEREALRTENARLRQALLHWKAEAHRLAHERNQLSALLHKEKPPPKPASPSATRGE